MRIDLPNDQWVDLRERITHAQDKEIRRARRASVDDAAATGTADTVALQVFVREGRILDLAGEPIDLTKADAMDRVPMDIADVLIGEILKRRLYTGATVPNEPTPS